MDSDSEDKLMEAIWLIMAYCRDGLKAVTGTGIENNRILTCEHGFKNVTKITARRVLDKKKYRMKIEHSRPDWDLSLLKFRHEGPVDFKSLKISENEVFNVDEEIILIGHANHQVASASIGKVVTACTKVDPSSFKANMGIVDTTYVEAPFTRDYPVYQSEINPHISRNLPMIECFGAGSRSGCSGGPYIKDGEIIGIGKGHTRMGFDIGIHVSALKELVREADERLN